MNGHGSLNRIFRVVWNVVLGEWQVASEHTKGKGKTKSVRLGSGFARLTAGSILVLCSAGALAELPTGGQITAGSGQIGTPSDGHMVINQNTNKMVIDWTSYSIGSGNSVQYIQPSADAIALNRVLGGDPSIIRGTISANGRVVLLNPNGILFGPTSKVEVASLLASTLNMSNEDFMAGNFNLTGNSANSVVNQGSIRAADGGFVALIAAKIENVGDIRVRGGEVLMGSGSKVRLDLGGPAKIEVDEAVIDGYIRNGGLIKAEGGSVVMTVKTASELASLAINNEGIIEATSLARGDGGTIQLLADGGTVTNSGTLNASSAEGKGGYVEVTGARVGILDGSVVDASGATGGGTVLLGGDYQGKNAAV
ncbi:MAG: filamentous hemagglutinin N-terminal domain-containing protein, partial [Oxalicibacterium faecigallinarum]|uniref:two-partner secretion domain-containing protein n=1 Tax=Oxalicibacterium faecigallinarum TaxID=573741 RepID=UPI002808672F